MGKQVTDYLLYRWRYILGYSLIALAVIGLVAVAGLMVPGGLSPGEMKSVVASDAISLSLSIFNPDTIINLPYHVLQRASTELFGITVFSIKLPSLILGLLSALGMLILLRTWFRQNVAIITTILVITTGQFLFVTQSGTPSVVYIFWTIWLLVAAMMVSRRAKGLTLWKMLLFGIAALSLYTPLSLYIIVALLSAVILHPHLRYIVRRLSKPKLLLAFFCGLIILAPLIYTIVRFPTTGLTLLGVPDAWPDLKANLLQILKQYFDFISPNSDMLMTPIYSLGSMILIALGFLRLVTTKYTARSYIISAWIILLLPVLVINPSYVSITFVPVVLLMAMGISQLLTRWYRLFPRNPYARLAGLVPLAVLISGMVVSGVDRYMYGYLYSPQVAVNFSDDLRLMNKQLNAKDRPVTQIVASDSEAAFYSVVAHHKKNVGVVTTSAPIPAAPLTIVSREARRTATVAGAPSLIITGSNTNDADRFYIYKTPTK
jgi:hypothetical protein